VICQNSSFPFPLFEIYFSFFTLFSFIFHYPHLVLWFLFLIYFYSSHSSISEVKPYRNSCTKMIVDRCGSRISVTEQFGL
jgi:hypothetical protein